MLILRCYGVDNQTDFVNDGTVGIVHPLDYKVSVQCVCLDLAFNADKHFVQRSAASKIAS
jgi:hypothetical protein